MLGYLQYIVTSQDKGQTQCLSGVVCAWQEDLEVELSIYLPACLYEPLTASAFEPSPQEISEFCWNMSENIC